MPSMDIWDDLPREGERPLPSEYSDEDLISRWEEFFEATDYRLKVIEVVALFPEVRSVHVRYSDLDAFDPDMADFVLQHPNKGLLAGEEAIKKVAPPGREGAAIHLRLFELPRDCKVEIRELRSKHMGRLISVEGLVRKATEVRPKVTDALFKCLRCGQVIREPQEGMFFKEPLECYKDQDGCGRSANSTKFKLLTEESTFVDTQKIEVQESPEGLRGGAQPERLVGFMEDDIAGLIAPGDRVILNGVLHSVQKGTVHKSTLFDIHLDVVSMEFEEHEYEEVTISPTDLERIRQEATDPEIFKTIIASISPTIYGYDIEKEAIALQLFGGVPKELDDGTRIRGDIHVLLVGDPGVAKCVSGTSLVLLADGRLVEIRELVDSAIERGPVGVVDDGVYAGADIDIISLGKDGRLRNAKADLVWKRKAPSRMLRFHFNSGKKITVTPTHPFFVWEGGIKPRPAEKMEEGDFVATPRELRVTGRVQDLPELDYRRSRSHNAVRLSLSSISPLDFWRLLGLMIGDGYVQLRENGVSNAFFTNNDTDLINEVYGYAKKMGMNPTIREPHKGKSSFEVVISGVEFCSLLSKLGMHRPSLDRRMPDPLFLCGNDEVASAISGFFDAEGSVRRGTRMISMSSSSSALLKDVQHLLLRLGIQSRIRAFNCRSRNRSYYRLLVSGAEVESFVEKIPYRSRDKRTRLSAIISNGSALNTNLDIVPNVASDLRRVGSALRMQRGDYLVPRATMVHYFKGDRNPSASAFSRIVSGLERRYQGLESMDRRLRLGGISWAEVSAMRESLKLSQSDLAGGMDLSQSGISYAENNCRESPISSQVLQGLREALSGVLDDRNRIDIESLKLLTEADIYWDRIERIEEIEPEEPFVYDLQVPKYHNYVAEDIIIHNSQLLRYMSELAPRGIYASGKSSSAAGLCVSPITRVDIDGVQQRIGEFVERHMTDPVEVEKGHWRQSISGPRIATLDGECNQIYAAIEAVWRINTPSFLVEIETSSSEHIRTTPETPVYARREGKRGWYEAHSIREGDELLRVKRVEGSRVWEPVKSIMFHHTDLPLYVYDLTVDGSHAFLGNGFLVHNTAAAVKDDFGEGRWTLEAGALVLADKGVACVDELDKMTDQDRSSMHEAMESQTISVAKAGITATLQCRCSILGAANPKYGRFEEHQYIADQINLAPALLSRFDLIFAMTDKPDAKLDASITNHILKSHLRGELRRYDSYESLDGIPVDQIMADTDELAPVWSREFFRKYVAYSKRITPVLSGEAMELIRDSYLGIRKRGEGQGSSVPITARQLEAFVRLSEASARARLSRFVSADDARRAVHIVEYYLNKIAGQEGMLDIDIIATGTSKSNREQISVLRQLIKNLSKGEKGVSIEMLVQEAEAENIPEERTRVLLKRLHEVGEVYCPFTGYYRLSSEG